MPARRNALHRRSGVGSSLLKGLIALTESSHSLLLPALRPELLLRALLLQHSDIAP